MAFFCVSTAGAFNASRYATTSKLATGKWVKITIPEDGVYEVTYEELQQMGFTNPAQVKVYGSGGARILEVLNGSAPDDLVKVPILRTNNKICFYGRGPVSFSMSDYSGVAHFIRNFNPYSQVGCYFLTEDSSVDLKPAKKSTVSVTNFINTPSSLGYFYHEKEQTSLSSSGKEMLGEDFSNGGVMVDYYLPDIADSSVVVHTAISANVSVTTFASAVLHSGGASDSTNYSLSMSRIYTPSQHVLYFHLLQLLLSLCCRQALSSPRAGTI